MTVHFDTLIKAIGLFLGYFELKTRVLLHR